MPPATISRAHLAVAVSVSVAATYSDSDSDSYTRGLKVPLPLPYHADANTNAAAASRRGENPYLQPPTPPPMPSRAPAALASLSQHDQGLFDAADLSISCSTSTDGPACSAARQPQPTRRKKGDKGKKSGRANKTTTITSHRIVVHCQSLRCHPCPPPPPVLLPRHGSQTLRRRPRGAAPLHGQLMFSCTLVLAPLVYSRMPGPPRALALLLLLLLLLHHTTDACHPATLDRLPAPPAHIPVPAALAPPHT
ncbi:hypothetical protein COCCADRAFT_36349 [Bipolaris zeicola 26-R-13]|uniref:Uncharacterized protein n=1 Tax=Cochliobolus carbonum (strain 26-R-13) TaxID=930089 RepID=W6YQZ3_COCC2|nr:uncharacterized protein COCCADRAFT_36349 [Bipolaris zeicola 26-R-13]EUC33896.1 hypothetical protein COCCADRAFT_36349 [Bipolaris zeicola 26-R-13]